MAENESDSLTATNKTIVNMEKEENKDEKKLSPPAPGTEVYFSFYEDFIFILSCSWTCSWRRDS